MARLPSSVCTTTQLRTGSVPAQTCTSFPAPPFTITPPPFTIQTADLDPCGSGGFSSFTAALTAYQYDGTGPISVPIWLGTPKSLSLIRHNPARPRRPRARLSWSDSNGPWVYGEGRALGRPRERV